VKGLRLATSGTRVLSSAEESTQFETSIYI
jgi:hypothetical protein